MQTQGHGQTEINLSMNALAAEGALRHAGLHGEEERGMACEATTEGGAEWRSVPPELQPEVRAMRGLAVAIPVSCALWSAIGALIWVFTR